MIFADKLITLRKKAGWSQEELAEKLNVTRQSVSKWEGAQSVPDIDKILQLSCLFGVTTDYLLKDAGPGQRLPCQGQGQRAQAGAGDGALCRLPHPAAGAGGVERGRPVRHLG